jgi:hypothetical protein
MVITAHDLNARSQPPIARNCWHQRRALSSATRTRTQGCSRVLPSSSAAPPQCGPGLHTDRGPLSQPLEPQCRPHSEAYRLCLQIGRIENSTRQRCFWYSGDKMCARMELLSPFAHFIILTGIDSAVETLPSAACSSGSPAARRATTTDCCSGSCTAAAMTTSALPLFGLLLHGGGGGDNGYRRPAVQSGCTAAVGKIAASHLRMLFATAAPNVYYSPQSPPERYSPQSPPNVILPQSPPLMLFATTEALLRTLT